MATLNNCTLFGSSAANGSGGGIYDDCLTMTNTIIAGNSAVSGADIENNENLIYGGSNLVQSVANHGSITGPAPLTNAPDLAMPGGYGGPTQTMPPLPGSPAIGAGNVAANTFATDQRGYPRTQNGLIDIGAVELPTVRPFTASPTNAWQFVPVLFASANVDSDGSDIVQWDWNFGDGSTGSGPNPIHAYATTGSFFPSLIVTNSLGLVLGVSGPSITGPLSALTGINWSGSNLVLNGDGGVSGLAYYVVTSTNLLLPLSQWTPLATNIWVANGNFSLTLTNALNGTTPQFYLLKVP
jgi:PKD repeat protein